MAQDGPVILESHPGLTEDSSGLFLDWQIWSNEVLTSPGLFLDTIISAYVVCMLKVLLKKS